MTGAGTNSYVVGQGEVALIDPGPALPAHRDAVLAALDPGERLAAILITHSHLDHTALARELAAMTGAPVWGAGPAGSGRSQRMRDLAAQGLAGGGEGFDLTYAPDRVLAGGAVVQFGGTTIDVLATPGHTGCHLGFAWGDRLFSGDTVMGWSTSLVSPPDGDMAAYMASLTTLAARDWGVIHPGHGAAIDAPAQRLTELIAHRKTREAEILAAMTLGPSTPSALAARVYASTPPALLPAASRNVLAHLIDLADRGQVTQEAVSGADWVFSLTPRP